MGGYTHLPALAALIDRARKCLAAEDLPSLVMSDPGSGGYVTAYRRVLAGGVAALLEEQDGRALYASFDITENLLLSHSEAARSSAHRWFSILTGCIELLGWDGHWELRGRSPVRSLGSLLTDGFALREAGDSRAPLALLAALCRELQVATTNRHEHAVALLCELMVGSLSEEEAEARCHDLLRLHDSFQPWCDDDGVENPWHVARPDLLWGLLVGSRAERDLWLALVSAHFPAAPVLARELRERLVREGAAWRRDDRRRR